MKVLIVFALTAFVVVNAKFSEKFKQTLGEEMANVIAQCVEKEKANEADIAELMGKEIPTRQEGKCLMACINQQFGLQTEDGKYTEDSVKKSLEKFKSEDAAIHANMESISLECLTEVKSADRCEAAVEMEKCFRDKAEAKGLKDEDLL